MFVKAIADFDILTPFVLRVEYCYSYMNFFFKFEDFGRSTPFHNSVVNYSFLHTGNSTYSSYNKKWLYFFNSS
jgi:hypothetical protein